jgi:hypothetical protein
MASATTIIGPADHGRAMSLADFDLAEVQEGHLYELSRGVVAVSEIPNQRHLAQVRAIRWQLWAHATAHPDQVWDIPGGSDCKILLPDWDSERHPDLAVYQSAPPDGRKVWSTWKPELVVEVVSPSSEARDYLEKREEYLDFGIKEYWIVDADKRELLALRRTRGKWKETVVREGDAYETPLLPGFALDFAKVMQAADAARP